MYVDFIDLEKAYDRVNRETLWQVLRMYDADGKILTGNKSMYVNSLASVSAKGGGNMYFRIENGVREGCIMSHRLFNVCLEALLKEVKREKLGGWE